MMKLYPDGKDQQIRPSIELEHGSLHTDLEILFAIIKAIIKKGILTKQEIKDEI